MNPTMIVSFLAVMLVVASAGMVGAPRDANLNDSEVQDALQFAKAQFNNRWFVLQIREVVKVQTQVVEGIKYIFTVKVARKSCSKTGVKTLCTAYGEVTQCKIEVWSRPWLNSTLVEDTCV